MPEENYTQRCHRPNCTAWLRRTAIDPGFTIVELLIVIVVIAILAAITIVTYNGITKKAIETSMQSDLRNADDTLKVSHETGESVSYPSDPSGINGGQGLKTSGNNQIAYLSNGEAYCVAITNIQTLKTFHLRSSDGQITEGICVGTVTTLAGSGVAGFADGTVASAQFASPKDVAVDTLGNVYVLDRDNYRIRKITPAGAVSTFVGSGTAGYANGTGTSAQIDEAYGLSIDGVGNLYLADSANNRIREITPGGVVSTLAGSGVYGYADGSSTSASFSFPVGVAVNASGTVYVADQDNNRIRMISGGSVSTFAGSGAAGFADGTGAGAQFNTPRDVAVDSNGNLYVADKNNNRIRKITPAGVVSTLAGSSTAGAVDGAGASAQFNHPTGVAVSPAGIVYVAGDDTHTIRAITPNGVTTTIAGSGIAGFADSAGISAQFSNPTGVAVDINGVLYVADARNNRIRRVTQF